MFWWITHRHASYSASLHPSTYCRNSAPPFSHPRTLGSWVSACWDTNCLSTTTGRERKQRSWSQFLGRGGGRARVTTLTSFMQSRNWPDNLPDTEFVMKLQPWSCRELRKTARKLSLGTELGMASQEQEPSLQSRFSCTGQENILQRRQCAAKAFYWMHTQAPREIVLFHTEDSVT